MMDAHVAALTALGMAVALIGIPTAAGYGAWRASSRMVEEVIYRRAATVRP